jgi:hypothetical protein
VRHEHVKKAVALAVDEVGALPGEVVEAAAVTGGDRD